MSLLVDIANLDFAYGQQLVLKQINLPIEQGSTLAIIGPNGGGKTTLLRLLLGLHRPTRGHVLIAGLTPQQAIARGDLIGYLPQAYSLPRDFPITVRQLVRLGLVGKTGLLHRYNPQDLEFVEWLLQRVGIAELANRPVGSISGGQQQRALIARALASKPKLMLLDEPTTGIDHSGRQRFLDFVLSLKQELQLTIVLVTHDLQIVTAMCDRIACLNVKLHYHDVPERLPADLAHEFFACDLEATGLAVRQNGLANVFPQRLHAPHKTNDPQGG
ncbi:MAG TPA: metal ABC transporter ATP-binding protein [Tepidisphaeraceae bacterium]|nr:metal ABC transporter ATP-binding protein [Tepidisphaeraceae bacterium]